MTDIDFYYFRNEAKKSYAKTVIEKGEKYKIHAVNKLNIYKFGYYVVINTESLDCKFFDSEEKAVNHVLNVYPQTKFNKQSNLFEQ